MTLPNIARSLGLLTLCACFCLINLYTLIMTLLYLGSVLDHWVPSITAWPVVTGALVAVPVFVLPIVLLAPWFWRSARHQAKRSRNLLWYVVGFLAVLSPASLSFPFLIWANTWPTAPSLAAYIGIACFWLAAWPVWRFGLGPERRQVLATHLSKLNGVVLTCWAAIL